MGQVVDCALIWERERKRKEKAKDRRARKRKNEQAKREAIARDLGFHRYTSWNALADAVAREKGVEPPGTRAQSRKFVRQCHKEVVAQAKQERARRAKPKPKSDEAFYSSSAWRELRYIALKNSGGCCTLCGARASDGVILHVDHITPRSVDPRRELDLDNLQILCGDCNIGKSNRDCIDWR